MELMHPWAIFVGIPIAIILTFFTIKKKEVFEKGKKVANTNFIEDTPLYKKLMREYKIFSTLSLICLWSGLALAIVMLARPVKVDVVSTELRNRDIFICLDVSTSIDELNLDICQELKEVVKDLDGERFGISIFNGKSVLLVPLTTDYDYVLEMLDKLETCFKQSIAYENGKIDYSEFDLYGFKYDGTLWEDGRGSSFIGDGLASCLYNFPDLKENNERSRLIIFITDNELNEITGTSFVTLDEAAALCAANDVKVFAVTPQHFKDPNNFQKAIYSTGGKHYAHTSDKIFDELLEDIRLTGTSTMEDTKVIITDKPEVLFIFMFVFMGMYFIFSRKVKL